MSGLQLAQAWVACFIGAVGLIWAFIGLRKLVAYVDRNRPRRDYVAERKRKITRNAFKSRIGRPYREYR